MIIIILIQKIKYFVQVASSTFIRWEINYTFLCLQIKVELNFKFIQMKEIKSSLSTWNFYFSEGGLSPSQQIDAIAQKWNLFRAPTIVFINNRAVISQDNFGFKISFSATEALKFINYQVRQKQYLPLDYQGKINTISYIPEKLLVKNAQHWKSIQKPKDIEITEIQESSDSFFLNTFKGHIEGKVKVERVKESVIPVEKLGPSNPVVFYQQSSFYEDELDDNGLIQYQYKFRAMSTCWFGLIRNYARVDEVTVQIYDTRIYWEEGWSKIARQFMVKKASWSQLKQSYQFPPGWTMNPNQSHLVYPFLKEQFIQNEYIHYG